MPESPRWLLEHDKEEEALRALARVRGLPPDHRLVQSDFSEMQEAHLLDAKAGNGSWWQCFRGEGKPNKAAYRTWLTMILMAFQQVSSKKWTGLTWTSFLNLRPALLTTAYRSQLLLLVSTA